MYCRECGEKNPEDAVFCRNCGKKLKEDIKKAKVIDTSNNYQHTNESASTNSSNSSSNDDWKCCCGCLIAIFIIFAIGSML